MQIHVRSCGRLASVMETYDKFIKIMLMMTVTLEYLVKMHGFYQYKHMHVAILDIYNYQFTIQAESIG